MKHSSHVEVDPPLPSKDTRFYSLRQSYQSYGTHQACADDIAAFSWYEKQFRRAQVKPGMRHYYAGWLNYELGVASQTVEPSVVSKHIAIASRDFFGALSASPDHSVIRTQYHLALLALLQARNDVYERKYGSVQRSTLGLLGQIGINALDGKIPYEDTNDLFGNIAEIAVAGTVLSSSYNGLHCITYPASPRQNSPIKATGRHTVDNIAGRAHTAIDFSLNFYDGQNLIPEYSVKSQVKARQLGVNVTQPNVLHRHNYENDILMLYGDNVIFVDSREEYRSLFVQFQASAAGERPGRRLEMAQENVALAFEEHSGNLS